MTPDLTKYEVELLCDYPQWWRYNIYIMIVPYMKDGGRMKHTNLVDRAYDVSTEFTTTMRSMPRNYDTKRPLKVVVEKCDYIEIFVYIIANTLPESLNIKDSPAFFATLRVAAIGMAEQREIVLERELEVNQWGGATVIGMKVDTKGERAK